MFVVWQFWLPTYMAEKTPTPKNSWADVIPPSANTQRA
jgi:hypothetical protein